MILSFSFLFIKVSFSEKVSKLETLAFKLSLGVFGVYFISIILILFKLYRIYDFIAFIKIIFIFLQIKRLVLTIETIIIVFRKSIKGIVLLYSYIVF